MQPQSTSPYLCTFGAVPAGNICRCPLTGNAVADAAGYERFGHRGGAGITCNKTSVFPAILRMAGMGSMLTLWWSTWTSMAFLN